MKVFISWSGDLSHKIAKVFRDWLPSVIQILEPYLSSEDIDKGVRWSTDISKELEASSYGILCVTKDNMDAPWLNFEAGALSKAFDKSRVSPFLFGVKRSEIQGPILQFQSTIYDKDDIKKLLHSLNSSCDPTCLDEGRLDSIFDVWWPKLQEELDKLTVEANIQEIVDVIDETGKSTDSAILEEILELVRNQQKRLNDPAALFPPEYLNSILQRIKRPFDAKAHKQILISTETINLVMEKMLSLIESNDFSQQKFKDLTFKLSESVAVLNYMYLTSIDEKSSAENVKNALTWRSFMKVKE